MTTQPVDASFHLGTAQLARVSSARPTGDAKTVQKDFQAVVLTTMIEAMLPQDAQSVFGSGTAGSVWRSMLADKLAHQLAERDVLGLGGTLERHIETLQKGRTNGGSNPASGA